MKIIIKILILRKKIIFLKKLCGTQLYSASKKFALSLYPSFPQGKG
jgi:hypothetical protein